MGEKNRDKLNWMPTHENEDKQGGIRILLRSNEIIRNIHSVNREKRVNRLKYMKIKSPEELKGGLDEDNEGHEEVWTNTRTKKNSNEEFK